MDMRRKHLRPDHSGTGRGEERRGEDAAGKGIDQYLPRDIEAETALISIRAIIAPGGRELEDPLKLSEADPRGNGMVPLSASVDLCASETIETS